MKQYEAVIKVMEENGGYATLGHLYQNVLKVPGCEWKTKTPYASIRRIVQDTRFFFKIKPGLWALKSNKEKILKKFTLDENTSSKKKNEFSHSYYQGLIAEIGNIKGYKTFIPNQDKNKKFLDELLGNVTTLDVIYPFTYPEVIKKAETIDVVWFNERNFPSGFFEVEHTTDFYNSLLKFNELQDFHSKFYIVSSNNRRKEFESKIKLNSFRSIQNRIKFLNYSDLSHYHAQSFKLQEIEQNVEL
jgi:hypothetical protein